MNYYLQNKLAELNLSIIYGAIVGQLSTASFDGRQLCKLNATTYLQLLEMIVLYYTIFMNNKLAIGDYRQI